MTDLLFKLPYSISFADQKTIIDYGQEHCSWAGPAWDLTVKKSNVGRFNLRRPTTASLALNNIDTSGPDTYINRMNRFSPNLEWEWIDTPITDLVKAVINPVIDCYSHLTRMVVLIQNINSPFPYHRDEDKIDAYVMDNGTKRYIQKDINRNMGLRVPLTEKENDNGLPVIFIDGEKYFYQVSRNLFALNETETVHGADPVNHYRGVIFLDGTLDYDKFSRLERIPVGLERAE